MILMTSKTTRRAVLAGAIGAPALVGAAAPAAGQDLSAVSALFDLNDPAEQLTAAIKVKGDTGGHRVWFWASGTMSALRPGQAPVHLANLEVARVSRYRRLSDSAFEHRYAAGLMVTDKETGALMDTFANPLNGHIGEVEYRPPALRRQVISTTGIKSDRPDGTVSPASFIKNPYLNAMQMPWLRVGDAIWVDWDQPFEMFGAPWTDAYKLRTTAAGLDDPNTTSAPMTCSYYGESSYYPWLGMSGEPGYLMWQGFGAKTHSTETLPARMRAHFSTLYPEFVEDPDQFLAASG